MSLWIWAVWCALAAPASVVVHARVSPSLEAISGSVEVLSGEAPGEPDAPISLVSPLALLPKTTDDRTLLRRFPGRADPGIMTWEPDGPGRWRFWTWLPRRYGDIGQLPGRGLRANGGWHPTVLVDGALPVLAWNAEIVAPGHSVVVLNGVIGQGEARWSGRAERLGLAVLPDATITQIGAIRLVEQGPEPVVHRQIRRLVETWPLGPLPAVTLVETLDLERLALAAPGMVFLSDRAFRLSPGVVRYHVEAVRRRIVEAGLPTPVEGADPALGDPWWRAWVAAALTEALPAASASEDLGWFAWNPIIDAILHDGTLPFYEDTFDETFAGPGGVAEITPEPRITPRAAALQLDTLLGEGTALILAEAVVAGKDPHAEALRLGAPPLLVEGWSWPYRKEQDIRVDLHDGTVRLEREAPADAPMEVVAVSLDGEPVEPWLAGPGADAEIRPLTPDSDGALARRVATDPLRATAQIDRSDDSWPHRWSTVVTGGVENIRPATYQFEGYGQLVWRRQGDTQNVYYVSLDHDDEDILGLYPGYVRYLGPLLDRRRRAHRIGLGLGLSYLDPGFRPTTSGSFALGGSVSYAWDTRVSDIDFSRGTRLGVAVGGGFIPGSDAASSVDSGSDNGGAGGLDGGLDGGPDRWSSIGLSAVQYLPLHPRHVLAFRARAGVASGEVEHRLLGLGGAGGVRAVPSDVVLGQQLLLGTLEYRATPLHGLSVPLGFAWLSAIQLVPGLDVGTLWRDGAPYVAVGAAGGVWTMVDLLGARPTLAGITVAAPLALSGLSPAGPQIFFDFFHPF